MTPAGRRRLDAAVAECLRGPKTKGALYTLLNEYERIKALEQHEPPCTVPGFPAPPPGAWADEITKVGRRPRVGR